MIGVLIIDDDAAGGGREATSAGGESTEDQKETTSNIKRVTPAALSLVIKAFFPFFSGLIQYSA